MKKYLFLLFLFFIYVFLSIYPKTSEVVQYNTYEHSILASQIEFPSGMNSNSLNNILKKYKKEYVVSNIDIGKTGINVLCEDFNNCINQIYEQCDSLFELNTLVSGFKINKINIITYNDYLVNFLDEQNINYKIK